MGLLDFFKSWWNRRTLNGINRLKTIVYCFAFAVAMVSEVLIASNVITNGFASPQQTGLYGVISYFIGLLVAMEIKR